MELNIHVESTGKTIKTVTGETFDECMEKCKDVYDPSIHGWYSFDRKPVTRVPNHLSEQEQLVEDNDHYMIQGHPCGAYPDEFGNN